MASLVSILCSVVLSACLSEAGRPYRQFQEVTQTTRPTTLEPITITTTTPEPFCMQDGVAYPVGASVPISDACHRRCKCYSFGVICEWYYESWGPDMPCVDVISCPNNSRLCPNGPNCHNPNGGAPIPDGQSVVVNGQQCYCLVTAIGYNGEGYSKEVFCPVTSCALQG
ncbi:uncharacterized protein LOC118415853 [Branchiostoma floridae]|uniref:Uncharacterized protein LOC118415853 n=1 Tax=Branchiostoma floridae TaxID=7739 RepID=A0A9J7L760_BRAFL|nr:uncharacterized protein LOC118415853 [Branchiostoma floridae]